MTAIAPPGVCPCRVPAARRSHGRPRPALFDHAPLLGADAIGQAIPAIIAGIAGRPLRLSLGRLRELELAPDVLERADQVLHQRIVVQR